MENKKQKIEEFKLYLKEEKEKYFKKIKLWKTTFLSC